MKDKSLKNKKDTSSPPVQAQQSSAPVYTQNIPEDEIWTFRIDGLQAPRIEKNGISPKINVIIVIVLLFAISCSIYFSIRAVHNDMFRFDPLSDGSYELIKYSNPGNVTEVTVDFVDGDEMKPVSVLHEYAFNCDEKVVTVTIGKDVKSIDGKSFYSCWSLQNIFVDDDNPYYCDIDGVLYNKELTEIIHYPCDHDKYLREKTGYNNLLDDDGKPMEELWGTTKRYDEAFSLEYNQKVRTYVIPSSVTKIGKLAFAYSNLTDIYIPEGVKTIETMGVFKNTVLENIYSYTAAQPVTDTAFSAVASFAQCYNSLPEGLEYIGSDAFTYDRGLDYLYIPASVTFIGHHAFWDTVYKEDGELKGVSEIHTPLSKDDFNNAVDAGDSWRPKYDYKLFKKNVELVYSSERQ